METRGRAQDTVIPKEERIELAAHALRERQFTSAEKAAEAFSVCLFLWLRSYSKTYLAKYGMNSIHMIVCDPGRWDSYHPEANIPL